VLESWEQWLPRFIKVFPHEYKRVLGVPRAAQAASLPGVAAAQTTQHVAVGVR
jgi:glutamate synthase domain-containing protein 3